MNKFSALVFVACALVAASAEPLGRKQAAKSGKYHVAEDVLANEIIHHHDHHAHHEAPVHHHEVHHAEHHHIVEDLPHHHVHQAEHHHHVVEDLPHHTHVEVEVETEKHGHHIEEVIPEIDIEIAADPESSVEVIHVPEAPIEVIHVPEIVDGEIVGEHEIILVHDGVEPEVIEEAVEEAIVPVVEVIEEAVHHQKAELPHNGQFFNTNFGQSRGGAFAIANSFSTGAHGRSESHSTAHGSH